MSTTYYAFTGLDLEPVTAEQIKLAFAAGQCRLLHGRRDGGSSTTLAMDGVDRDTRGQCESMREEVWTHPVKSLQQAYGVARVKL